MLLLLPAMKNLFALKYLHGISDKRILAEELKLPHYVVPQLEIMLDHHLQNKIKVITPERLELVCPECLNARVYYDPETGERVCGSCGAVLDSSADYDESLPYDVTYALTSELAYDKSLGGTLNGKAIMRVLAKSPATESLARNGNTDLGLRARMIKILTETVEPPPLSRSLKQAYALSRFHNLEGDKLFNHSLGRNVRKAFWIGWMLDQPFTRRTLAETCFWLTLTQHGKKALAQSFGKTAKINKTLIVMLVKLDSFLKDLKRTTASLNTLELALSLQTP